MTLSQEEWGALSQMDGVALRDRVFSILQETARGIQERDPDDPSVLGVVPRLVLRDPSLDRRRVEFSGFVMMAGWLRHQDSAT